MTAVYHDDMKDTFAEDLSVIIKSRWDVEHTNMAGDYDPDTIMDTFEKELGCKLIDGHTYSFSATFSYIDNDHADDFYMDIEDVTTVMRQRNNIVNAKKHLSKTVRHAILWRLLNDKSRFSARISYGV